MRVVVRTEGELTAPEDSIRQAFSDGLPGSDTDAVCFGEVHTLGSLAVARVGRRHEGRTVRAQATGENAPEALLAAISCLPAPEPATRAGQKRGIGPLRIWPRQVAELAARTAIYPLDAPPTDTKHLTALLDERFVPHLSDAEALRLARSGGEPFLVHAHDASHEIRVWFDDGSAWRRIDDVESLGWASDEATRVARILDAEGRRSEIPIGDDRIVPAATLEEAHRILRTRGHRWGVVSLQDLESVLFVAEFTQDLVIAITYAHRLVEPALAGPAGVPEWAHGPAQERPRTERLRDLLGCPACGSKLAVARGDAAIPCSCGRSFAIVDGVFDFLGNAEELHDDDPHASSNPVSFQLHHDLRMHRDGLVLNAGAGDIPLRADHLVNLEIVRYPTTDVVADGQALPFVDGAFDMVFSQSVVEHVPNPFRYASEVQRVLAPGGTLLVDAPFIAPFHGYPNHFFNPTRSGLRKLFEGMEELGLREGPHHEPSQALGPLLNQFLTDLRTDEARREWLQMPIGAFLEHLRDGTRPDLTRALARDRTFIMSAGFALYARKPS